MITRESVEALRKHLDRWPDKSVPFHDGTWSITVAELRALCDHYLSTPAAEPTAGDVRALVTLTPEQADQLADWMLKYGDLDKNSVCLTALSLRGKAETARAQRQARPSLGTAAVAVMAERERCAKIAEDHYYGEYRTALDIAAAIRASSPEGEGGRET